MKHIVAIVLKFIMVLVLLEILLSLMTPLSVTQILVISAAVTILSYVVGDLLILAISNNTVAALSDAVLAFFTIWLFNYLPYYGGISVRDAVISAIILGVAEIIFHKYIAGAIFPNHKRRRRT
jgi:hypothetical protein